jgi:hypothetical protein
MKSLQMWLAVLGGLVLAAVIAHGAWQQRSGRRARESDGTESNFAPLEPNSGAEPLEPADTELTRPAELSDEELAPPPVLRPPVPRRQVFAPRIDGLIDAIVLLQLEAPVSGEALISHLPPTRRAGGKPFAIEGRNQATGEWESPATETWYTELQAGVQMANRLGPLNEIEYSEFVQKIQAFADALGATPDVPDMLDVVARARELDGFAGDHDAQLAMRLHASRGPWPLGWVLQHTQRHGFVPGATPGRLILPSGEDGAPAVLALQFDAQAALADDPREARITEMSLLFDVPQTAARDQPFNAWCAAGQALSIALDAQVFDDQGQPLRVVSFPRIAEELDALYQQLAERELAAGSSAARRLFS